MKMPTCSALQLRIAEEHRQLGALGDVVRHGDRRVGVALQRPAEPEQEHADPDRDPVEHDRRDHLVRARDGLQQAGDRPPRRPRQARGDHREQDVQQGRHAGERRADPDREVGADEVLALAADVEQPAPERERHGEAGEDQRRREDQRRLQVELGDDPVLLVEPLGRVEAGAVEDRLVGLERVAAGDEHDQPADDEREDHRDDRRDDPAAAQVGRQAAGDGDGRADVRLGAHAAACLRPPPVIATPKSSSEADGSSSATISPS